MLYEIENMPGGLAIVRMRGRLSQASIKGTLCALAARLQAAQNSAVLFEMSQVSSVNMAGLSALIDVFKTQGPINLAVSGVPNSVTAVLRQVGLDTLLPSYDTLATALDDPELRKLALKGTRAVVLCAERTPGTALISDALPSAMLDVLGRPILDHVLDHLQRCGLRDIILNPGHLGPAITRHVADRPRWHQSVFCVQEGRFQGTAWHAAPLGSASSLRAIQDGHSAFSRDFVVLNGNTLTDVDLSAMMMAHRNANADMTVAVQRVSPDRSGGNGSLPRMATHDPLSRHGAESVPANMIDTGIYIMSPSVLDLVPEGTGYDISRDLVGALAKAGGHILMYDEPFEWHAIQSGQGYIAACNAALDQRIKGLQIEGRQTRPGLWQHETADVSRWAKIDGPAYIGAGVQIRRGATLKGSCVIGTGSRIGKNAFVRSSVIQPQTDVADSSIVDHMIANGDWAFDHRFATGTAPNLQPHDGVGHRSAAPVTLAQAV